MRRHVTAREVRFDGIASSSQPCPSKGSRASGRRICIGDAWEFRRREWLAWLNASRVHSWQGALTSIEDGAVRLLPRQPRCVSHFDRGIDVAAELLPIEFEGLLND